MEKAKITFNEFLEIESKLEIKIGQIVEAERIPKSDKMLKLTVAFSDTDFRTVVTNIGSKYEPESLKFVSLPFITNLEPAKIMGVVSEAMIVMGTNLDGSEVLNVKEYSEGTKLM